MIDILYGVYRPELVKRFKAGDSNDAMIDTLYGHGKELIGADGYITLPPDTTGSETVAIATATETE